MQQIYPKNFKLYKQVFGYGGVRIYVVSKSEAKEIAKEFSKSFRYSPPFPPTKGRLFYMNVGHGKQHFIFSLSKPARAKTA